MKNVLITLDYDPTAQKIAEAGYQLASALEAQTTLLHVVADEVYYSTRAYTPIMGFAGFSPVEPIEGEQNEYLKEAAYTYLNNIRTHLGDQNIRTMVKEGEFADVILETADLIGADIIVLGSHSKRWLEKVVMGSVTEKVMKLAKIPILIVPTGKKD
ncbi:MAG TPA: universal stress protein [Lentimicrobium sp.]|nr:universal stress protein [Lentimicrobium sp.]